MHLSSSERYPRLEQLTGREGQPTVRATILDRRAEIERAIRRYWLANGMREVEAALAPIMGVLVDVIDANWFVLALPGQYVRCQSLMEVQYATIIVGIVATNVAPESVRFHDHLYGGSRLAS
ncbi:MAG: hypothetical protein KDA92_20270 [Planctomycetales bacterium]|nr:hypothetical protein [Planctomycetales bacterium]